MRSTPLFAVILCLALAGGAAEAKSTKCKDATGKPIACPASSAPPAPKVVPTKTAAASSAKPAKPSKPSLLSGILAKHPVAGTPPPKAVAGGPAVSGPVVSGAPKSSAPAGGPAPTGATAKCKDGTYSFSKTHSGSCSHHGGVANWL
jgi:hypothetical protein